jgi:hypothetical protein
MLRKGSFRSFYLNHRANYLRPFLTANGGVLVTADVLDDDLSLVLVRFHEVNGLVEAASDNR